LVHHGICGIEVGVDVVYGLAVGLRPFDEVVEPCNLCADRAPDLESPSGDALDRAGRRVVELEVGGLVPSFLAATRSSGLQELTVGLIPDPDFYLRFLSAQYVRIDQSLHEILDEGLPLGIIAGDIVPTLVVKLGALRISG